MMRKFTKIVFSIALLGLTTVACKEAKEKASEKEATEEQKELNSSDKQNEETNPIETTAVLNANLATEKDLIDAEIPVELISQIIEKRPFLRKNNLDAIVGDVTNKEELYKKVFVPFNLNTTAEDDFKMIPGVGKRMAHEFEEYRPYISIAQFRKEIGKYVDKEEVARYESYVFVPIELNTASEETIMALPGVGKRIAHEFEEYRPYTNMVQFRKEIGKYVDDKELSRLERLVYLKQ